jgi:hypothetical protein
MKVEDPTSKKSENACWTRLDWLRLAWIFGWQVGRLGDEWVLHLRMRAPQL